MTTRFEEFLARGRAKWGDRFRGEFMPESFIAAFNSGERVTVQFRYGETKRGTIGVTTGWAPVFILLLRKDSTGSMYTIGEGDTIIA